MTRKDFELIAAIVRNADLTSYGNHTSEKVRRIYAESFADALTKTNPYFDRARFLAACGRSKVAR